jgi:DNA-binding PadR family transcriptional regulator/pimeloyl-ACP methyl ester carboxylesterase
MRSLTTTEYAVLGTIAAGERSGYDLARSAEPSVGHMWAPSRSQIYKVLPRLVGLGLADVRAVAQEKRPDKALYRITERGRAELRRWVEEVEEEPSGGNAVFLMKVFFGWAADAGAVRRQLDAYERYLSRRLEEFRALEAGLGDDEPVHSRLALAHGIARASATLAWVAQARTQLAAFVAAVVAVVLFAAPPAGRALDSCTPRSGDVSFRAADGIRLAGHLFGHGRVGIVLAHQSNGSVCQWTTYGRRLAQLGYAPLAFDFRGYGASQTATFLASARQGGDVAAAVRYLRAHGVQKVFLVGASLGGSAVLQAAANVRPPVAGVVSVSGADYLVDAPGSATRLRVPVLYVAGSYDGAAAGEARHLFSLTRERDRQLAIFADGRHGVDLVDENAAARKRIEAFLRSH